MGETLIKIEDLSKVFFSHKAEIRAVDHVSFTIRKGETVGIVGESGCGKTTLADVLCVPIRRQKAKSFIRLLMVRNMICRRWIRKR